MPSADDEEKRLRAVALQTAAAVSAARSKAERELAAERERLRITLASIGDAVISTDPAGHVTYLNPVAEHLTGWPQADAAGKHIDDMFRIVNETTRRPVECPVRKVLATGTVVGLANHTVLISRDGAERPIDDSAAPIRDAAGGLAGVVLVFRDISDRRRADDARARLAAIVESSEDAVVSKTLDGVVLSWNAGAERLFGYPAGEAVGRPITVLIPADRLAEEADILARVRRGEKVDHFETVRVTKGGRRVDVSLTVSPIRDAGGRIVAASKVARDITARKRDEAAVRASEERFRFLDALGTATRAVTDAEGVMAATARLLGERLGVARTAYADVDADADRFTIHRDWTAPGVPTSAGVYSLDLFGPRAAADMRAGRPLVIRDVDRELAADAGADTFNAIGIKALVCCPLVKGGRLAAMMAVHSAVPRDWADAEVALVREVVERSWAHVERVRDAAALREKDARLALLVENVRDYAVVVSDPAGRVLEWQGGAERITGYAAAEAVGRPAHLIFTPEDRAAGVPEQEMGTALRDGRAEDKRWHLRKDGTRFHADGVMTALYDPAGGHRGFGKVFKDATGEELAKEERRQHADRLRSLADVSTRLNAVLDLRSVLGVVTEEGRRLLSAHQAAAEVTTDAAARPVRAHSFSDRYGPDLPPPDRSRVYPAVADGGRAVRLTHAELTAHPAWADIREAAEEHPALRGLVAAPVVAPDGRPLGVIRLSDKAAGEFTEEDEAILVQLAQMAAVAVENARLYQALRDADRRKDDFLALLAHELRNPLAPIRNGLQVVRLSNDEAVRGRAQDMMDRQLGHMVRLIDDLLDVSRVSRNKMTLRRERITLADAVAHAAESARPAIDAAGHTFAVTLPPQPVYLDADLTRLAQVFANLLTNSAKYTPRGGRIGLTAEVGSGNPESRNVSGPDALLHSDLALPTSAFVTVAVTDTGTGIPAESLPRIFDMFSQVDRSLERSTGGLGIGLALVKGLVEMHGGTVSAASGGEGRGSTFTVTLPVSGVGGREPGVGAGAGGATGLSTESRPPTPASRKILVVDDNRDSAASMQTMLALLGHETAMAHDGEEAVAAAEAFRPDLILMDVGMPKLNGLDATRRIRAASWGRAVTIVALTGWGQANDRERSRAAGCDGHLVKPVAFADLQRVLATTR